MTQLGFEKSHRDFRCVICLSVVMLCLLFSNFCHRWYGIGASYIVGFFSPLLPPIILRTIFSFYSFRTEQVHVALYMTAIASISNLVQKPIGTLLLLFQLVGSLLLFNIFAYIWYLFCCLQVLPEDGLEVLLSGSGATGKPPITLSPTVLIVDWTCMDSCCSV